MSFWCSRFCELFSLSPSYEGEIAWKYAVTAGKYSQAIPTKQHIQYVIAAHLIFTIEKRKKKMAETKKELIKANPTPEALIAQAIDNKVDVATMEKLLAMRNQLKAEQAKEAFFRSLSEFQSRCPVIRKETKVDYTSKKGTHVKYSYATLDSIISQVASILKECGFSYTIQTKQENGNVTAITTIHHVDGHSESSEFQIPIDQDSYMNAAQKVASALTYAKRYSFCNAFGILTGDEDDDAQVTEFKNNGESVPTVPKQDQNQTAIDEYHNAEDYIKEKISDIDFPPVRKEQISQWLEKRHPLADIREMRQKVDNILNKAKTMKEELQNDQHELEEGEMFEN